ncbi:MAG: 50S ribosomal protein L25 [Thermodesulfovibrionales bacterium]|nr:50S ribosomal protein L25 [Thermodesulfovibrionales bacterium]
MEKIVLNAEKRDAIGKGAARALRRAGMIPAVVYREGKAQPIQIRQKEFMQLLKTTSGEQVIINLKFSDGTDKLAMMKECQTDPTKDKVIHTDFFEVSLTEKIKTLVHIVPTGEPIGVKRDGGILQHSLREVEIECFPDTMPGRIEIDISGLATGHSIHVSDLRFGEGIKVLTNPGEVIAIVTAPVVEAAPAVEAEAAAAAAEEPEVIKKGKKEEGEEGEKA